jgi:hypothetical protein
VPGIARRTVTGQAVAVRRQGAGGARAGLLGRHGAVHERGGDHRVAVAGGGEVHGEGEADRDADVAAHADLDLARQPRRAVAHGEVERDRHRVVVADGRIPLKWNTSGTGQRGSAARMPVEAPQSITGGSPAAPGLRQ